jgi:hypothetical protein
MHTVPLVAALRPVCCALSFTRRVPRLPFVVNLFPPLSTVCTGHPPSVALVFCLTARIGTPTSLPHRPLVAGLQCRTFQLALLDNWHHLL